MKKGVPKKFYNREIILIHVYLLRKGSPGQVLLHGVVFVPAAVDEPNSVAGVLRRAVLQRIRVPMSSEGAYVIPSSQ